MRIRKGRQLFFPECERNRVPWEVKRRDPKFDPETVFSRPVKAQVEKTDEVIVGEGLLTPSKRQGVFSWKNQSEEEKKENVKQPEEMQSKVNEMVKENVNWEMKEIEKHDGDDEKKIDQIRGNNSNCDQKFEVKKITTPAAVVPRKSKPRARTSTSGNNDYYYYSGFGPRWGRKRSMSHGENDENNEDCETHRIGVKGKVDQSGSTLDVKNVDDDGSGGTGSSRKKPMKATLKHLVI